MYDFPPTLGNHHLHNVACIKGGGGNDVDDGPIFLTFSTFMSLLEGKSPDPPVCMQFQLRSIFRSYSFFLFHPTAMHSNFPFHFLPLLSLIGFFIFLFGENVLSLNLPLHMVRNTVSSGCYSSCWATPPCERVVMKHVVRFGNRFIFFFAAKM